MRRIQSVDRSLDILEALANSDRPMGVSEIGKQLGIHVATTHGILATLLSRGYVEQEEGTNRYRLGYKFYQLARLYINQCDLHQAALPHLHDLRTALGERVSLATLRNFDIVFLIVLDSYHLLRLKPNVENSTRIHCTAIGKVLLAFQPTSDIEYYLEHTELVRYTANTIGDKDAFLKHLEEIRAQGYALNEEEEIEGVFGIGAPVFYSNGFLAGAVSTAIPTERLDRGLIPEKIDLVVNTARLITRELGVVTIKERG
ncbi:MAG: IclR family transcriptional regulator [Limnochordia bacterium]